MARPIEQKPWHADALRMRSEGVSFSQIAEALQVNVSTVKAFVMRNSGNAERQNKILLQDKPRPKLAPVEVPEERKESLIDMVMVVESARGKTMLTALGAIQAFQSLTVEQMDTQEFKLITMKMHAGIETLKAMKGGGSLIDLDLALRAPGGALPEEEKLEFEVVDPAPQGAIGAGS